MGPASETKAIKFSSTPAPFGFADLDAWFTNADGTSDTQAGSHPYELTVAYAANSKGVGAYEEVATGAQTRDLVVNLPPGIVGNPTAVPRCTRRQFDEETLQGSGEEGPSCPAATQIGVDQATVGGNGIAFKVYNLVPPPGVAAQFGFDFSGVPVFLDAGVRTGGPTPLGSDYGITEHVDNVPEREIVFNATTIWGVPGEESHFAQRGRVPSGGHTPFLTLPTSCEGPQETSIEALDTWTIADTASLSTLTHDDTGTPTGFTGCDHLGFEPSISVSPDTGHADTPAGLTVNVEAPQQGATNPEGLSTSNIKNTTVTLPAGVAINPGQAAGLLACQPGEDGVGTEGPPHCPNASKVGTVEIETPLLADKLQGNVYVLPSDPPHMQLLVAASGDGVNLKLIGDVHLNEATGQLTTTFSETPELPFSDLKLAFSGGAQAALETPSLCGTYETVSDFTPWSTPLVQDAFPFSSFAITSGPDGTACEDPLPFKPELIAGATTDQAGGYTSFSMLLQRGDGQQRIKSLQFKTPEGLLGMISKVPLCGEPQAADRDLLGGEPDRAHGRDGRPRPVSAGRPRTGAAAGADLPDRRLRGRAVRSLDRRAARNRPVRPGQDRRAGPDRSRPAHRAADGHDRPVPAGRRRDPRRSARHRRRDRQARVHVQPDQLRADELRGNRDQHRRDDGSDREPLPGRVLPGAEVPARLQSLHLRQDLSRADGASLDAKIVYPVGNLGFNQASSQSNIQEVKVELPKRLPSRLTTLQKACPAATFEANPANCPAASVVGHATAVTPVLPVPLTGPAYFVSHGGEAFPSLIVVLQGYGVTVDLVGSTFISKQGITSSTLQAGPRRPDPELRARAPARSLLGARREREPLQRQHVDADRIHRAERGVPEAVHEGHGHRLPQGQEGHRQAQAEDQRQEDAKAGRPSTGEPSSEPVGASAHKGEGEARVEVR